MELKKQTRSDTYSIQISIKEKGRVLGWAFLVVIRNDRHDEPYGLLENVYVETAYRNQGLGGRLVQAVIEEAKAKGCYKILATTRYSKPEIQKWYEKLGFRNHGIEFRLDLSGSKPKQKD